MPAQLSGPYVIGPGGNYANIAAAISALTTSGVSGPVSFLVTANDTGPWTLGAFPGQGTSNPVLFDGQGTTTISGTQPVLTLSGCASVTFRGFNAAFTSNTHSFVINAGTTDCVFTGCDFKTTVTTTGSTTGANAVFNFAGGSGCRIEDSTFGGSYEALYSAPANDSTTVQRCKITGGGFWIMRLAGSNFTLVNNFITGVSNYGINAGVSGATSTNLRIRNNSVYINHPTTSSQFCSLRWYSTAAGTEVLNNIFYDAYTGTAALNMWCSGSIRPAVMNYNCFYSNIAGYFPVFATANQTLASWQALGFDLNSIQADPTYVAPGATPPDLRLLTGSPCATAGTPLAAVPTDLFQSTRTTPVSIGAHEEAGGPGAFYAVFGGGCAGTAGVPTNTASPTPTLGATIVVKFGRLPTPNTVAMLIGASNTVSSLGPLPIHLLSVNAPGCALRVSLEVPVTLVGSGGSATLSLPIPNQPQLLGVPLYTQGLVLDPGRNGLGAVMSDSAILRIGV